MAGTESSVLARGGPPGQEFAHLLDLLGEVQQSFQSCSLLVALHVGCPNWGDSRRSAGASGVVGRIPVRLGLVPCPADLQKSPLYTAQQPQRDVCSPNVCDFRPFPCQHRCKAMLYTRLPVAPPFVE